MIQGKDYGNAKSKEQRSSLTQTRALLQKLPSAFTTRGRRWCVCTSVRRGRRPRSPERNRIKNNNNKQNVQETSVTAVPVWGLRTKVLWDQHEQTAYWCCDTSHTRSLKPHWWVGKLTSAKISMALVRQHRPIVYSTRCNKRAYVLKKIACNERDFFAPVNVSTEQHSTAEHCA